MSRRPTALLLHGAGSTGDAVARALGPALGRAGYDVVAPDLPRARGADALAAVDAAVRRVRPAVLGGVSRGAHLAVRWVAGCGDAVARGRGAHPWPEALVLVAPAWTGAPGATAALSAAASRAVAADGVQRALDRARSGAWPWVAEELGRTWPTWTTSDLATDLARVAAEPGPGAGQLRSTLLPAGVVGLRGDPFHPLGTARRWTRLLPRAALVELDAAALADTADLGEAAARALADARRLSRPTARRPAAREEVPQREVARRRGARRPGQPTPRPHPSARRPVG